MCLLALLPLLLLAGPSAALAASLLRGGREASARTNAYQFSYNHHGGDWRMGQCGSRELQSPINFDGFAPWWWVPSGSFWHDYDKLEDSVVLQQNGHSLSADVYSKGYGGVTYEGQYFEVVSINFHVRSEHTFHGVPFPMEAHIVHKSATGTGQGLVIAVPFSFYQAPPPPVAAGQQYYYLGWGMCNVEFFSGWSVNRKDAMDFASCAKACDDEPKCNYFSLAQGLTCSRFYAQECSGRMQGRIDHVTYMKAPDLGHPYNYMGAGMCTLSPYVWGKKEEAAELRRCSDLCTAESQCKFFTFKKDVTCSRFTGSPALGTRCGPNKIEDLLSFEKVIPPMPYMLLGAGHCAEGLYVNEVALDLSDCQQRCSQEKKCSYIAISANNNCTRFTEEAGFCNHRKQAGDQDYITYEKLPLGASAPLASLLGKEPLPGEGQRVTRKLDVPASVLTELVQGGQYFEYQGSLTAPPCTEEVTWLVRRTPLTFSQNQSKLLNMTIKRATSDLGNWREVMPLMGRQIAVRQAVPGVPLQSLSPPGPRGPPVPVPLAAEATAQEANGWAMQANNIVHTVHTANQRYGFPVAIRGLSTLSRTAGLTARGNEAAYAQDVAQMQAEADLVAQRSLQLGGGALSEEEEA